mmetsp:Transcript_22758/g.47973  ORF Transcript_22758/g.47973 Transcript_22758/m.47973 type:complete len:291 (-) Transcript_22758:1278-2150(-)
MPPRQFKKLPNHSPARVPFCCCYYCLALDCQTPPIHWTQSPRYDSIFFVPSCHHWCGLGSATVCCYSIHRCCHVVDIWGERTKIDRDARPLRRGAYEAAEAASNYRTSDSVGRYPPQGLSYPREHPPSLHYYSNCSIVFHLYHHHLNRDNRYRRHHRYRRIGSPAPYRYRWVTCDVPRASHQSPSPYPNRWAPRWIPRILIPYPYLWEASLLVAAALIPYLRCLCHCLLMCVTERPPLPLRRPIAQTFRPAKICRLYDVDAALPIDWRRSRASDPRDSSPWHSAARAPRP